MKSKWVVVEHSASGYKGDAIFSLGLETRCVITKHELDTILRKGGIVFDNYSDAEDFAFDAMYASNEYSLIPKAKGSFDSYTVDGLRIYIPVREVVG